MRGLSPSEKDRQIRIVIIQVLKQKNIFGRTLLFISRLPLSLKGICVNQNIGVMYCTLSETKICNSTQK